MPTLPWVLGAGLLTAALPLPSVQAGERGEIVFTPRQIASWSERDFAGRTVYETVDLDGREALEARCDNAGSALYLEREIDLRETPVLEWSWRVDRTFGPAIDETAKAGDDYPARIYVVVEDGWLPWRARAISYVWASAMEQGADWPNAYASQARMVALRSGPPRTPGTWKTERRNIREDFQRYHGRDIATIHALALMSDCNDLQTTAKAWYGDIRFVSE